ncbi:uncharacterized protein LOC124944677 [Impatiens glandulifera]|uniref:uncharacterized protein LOC124944677 n=1 Tax=Impatiens glandulifera TaxID=253017 RepID=UPI001FB19AE7|nr:uncharacterized protein LOC124944677 [Impatiens glandulifera]
MKNASIMAQHRQQGVDRLAARNHGNGAWDHVSVGIRGPHNKQFRNRRLRGRKVSIGAVIVVLCFVFALSILAYIYLSSRDNKDTERIHGQDDDLKSDSDFLINVTRTKKLKKLMFGHGSVTHGRDSRYWDRDDRRRDEDYNEDILENKTMSKNYETNSKANDSLKRRNGDKKSSDNESKRIGKSGVGFYNEAGRDELKMYEAEYKASLDQSREEHNDKEKLVSDEYGRPQNEELDGDDEYDDGIDFHDDREEEDDTTVHDSDNQLVITERLKDGDHKSSDALYTGTKARITEEEASNDTVDDGFSSQILHSDKAIVDNRHVANRRSASGKHSNPKKKSKRRKFSGSCDMKLLNTSRLVEPLESRKFARFSLQYTQVERPHGEEHWEPKFSGHQNLMQREASFYARDQKINCGFVRGPKGSQSTEFELAEDDTKYISSCHIAVISCIFGNSDRLRSPIGKTVSRLSRKNVCFVMFVDEITRQTLSSEGQMPDRMGFVGLWKVVVVKNLPNTDMRRVGKVPKLLAHRLFPSARYSIWLDSKLRLQLDPLLILEYFLWRKGFEYAISNHYDRHCLWEEVAQNKKLNKYNHTVIDEQFEFYQADGLQRFNASDPNKFLPSNVPEGSLIIRAHTPMSNLFSCLWYNEVERFTPRDQLSFAYTYHKLRKMNPNKPFYLHMFKDCERRAVAKLYHHRSEESRNRTKNLIE